MANWAGMLPIDTVKSRFQVAPQGKYSSVFQVAKEILAVDGIKGFYKVYAQICCSGVPGFVVAACPDLL
jgi:solute carrier family 25 carnitine/acylcarnitine transporter 20/29